MRLHFECPKKTPHEAGRWGGAGYVQPNTFTRPAFRRERPAAITMTMLHSNW